jgi:RNA:NAD 2'-phosphotransferase (TPT1/KptA family)
MVPSRILSAIDTPAQTQLLQSEFLALRTLVLALHTEILNGNKITEQRITAMIQHVEAKKFALADNRIRAFQSQPKSHTGSTEKS